MENGYFFCGDIIGFSNLVERFDQRFLHEKISIWTGMIHKIAMECKITKFQMLSDTVYVAVGEGKSELKKIIIFSRKLLNLSINQSLPIRGAISLGTYQWAELVYGKAVIESHKLEKKQNWIGVILNQNVIVESKDYQAFNLICYKVPIVGGMTQTHPVVVWNIPNSIKLSKLLDVLVTDFPNLGWNYNDKITNTILFRLYINLLRKRKVSLSEAYGTHPMHFIEPILERQICS